MNPRLLTLVSLLFLQACSPVAPPADAPASVTATATPTPPSYSRMDADLPGPDGVLYPNFTFAGLPDDVAYPQTVLTIDQFGGQAGRDVAPALKRAVVRARELGGAVIQFGHGTYYLDSPVHIDVPNVVIRGQGRGGPGYFSTTLDFRFEPGPGTVHILHPDENGEIHPEGYVLVVADPGLKMDYWQNDDSGTRGLNPDKSRQLKKITLYIDDREWFSRDTIAEHHHAPQTVLETQISHMWNAKFQDGETHKLRAVAEWADGRRAETSRVIRINGRLPDSSRAQGDYAILSFAGPGRYAPETFFELELSEAAKRGDTSIAVNGTGDFQPGDIVRIHTRKAPPGRRFGGGYLMNAFQVTRVEENRIHFDQPLRLELPLEAEPRVRKQVPLRNCGVENLVIRQSSDTWINGVSMREARGVWVRDVEFQDIGRCPIAFQMVQRAEVRNVLMNGARYPSAGGMSAYAGFFMTVGDSLMENVTAVRQRHAPNFQGQSSGNVVRNSTFENSDLQFHAFYPYENLVENCRVHATPGTGSYGHGVYTPRGESQHGQTGPRNVVYGNDVVGFKSPIFFGSAEEGFVIAHNRFQTLAYNPFAGREPMPVFQMREGSSNNLFLNNLFVLRDARDEDLIRVEGRPGTGNVFRDNVILGVRGSLEPNPAEGWESTWENNRVEAEVDEGAVNDWEAPRSLYLHQRRLLAR